MTPWNSMFSANMGQILCEDVNAPELRNPKYTAIHSENWLIRLLRKLRR